MQPEMTFEDCRFLTGNPAVLDARPHGPFSTEDMLLLERVSSLLMADDEVKRYPDVMSFAFWCRRSRLASLKEHYADRVASRLGRGLVLHIAPSNVPVNFAFSWAFSLLAGNANVVRLPSKSFHQVDVMTRVIATCLEEVEDERNAFVRYPSHSDVTERLSGLVDARVIWGGDETVHRVKEHPSKPRCVDVTFPDRYSVAFLDGGAIGSLGNQELEQLVDGFYNDTYLMDQNACSSARVVFWVDKDLEARARFWNALKEKVLRSYELQPAVAVEKYIQLCRDAINETVRDRTAFDGNLEVVSLADSHVPYDQLRGKGGYFYECSVRDIDGVLRVLGPKCQTITYFGLDPSRLRGDVIRNGCAGIDRIVPVGSALDIDIVWDGYDLIETLSREITIR